jgi:hypothetical protein
MILKKAKEILMLRSRKQKKFKLLEPLAIEE